MKFPKIYHFFKLKRPIEHWFSWYKFNYLLEIEIIVSAKTKWAWTAYDKFINPKLLNIRTLRINIFFRRKDSLYCTRFIIGEKDTKEKWFYKPYVISKNL